MTLLELEIHGKALEICLASGRMFLYGARCREGRVAIVAIVDTATELPVSTAEFLVTNMGRDASICVTLKQHTAYKNGRPSSECTRAVRELLDWLRGRSCQQHLRMGLDLIARRDSLRQSLAERCALDQSVTAVRSALGEKRYQALVRDFYQRVANQCDLAVTAGSSHRSQVGGNRDRPEAWSTVLDLDILCLEREGCSINPECVKSRP